MHVSRPVGIYQPRIGCVIQVNFWRNIVFILRIQLEFELRHSSVEAFTQIFYYLHTRFFRMIITMKVSKRRKKIHWRMHESYFGALIKTDFNHRMLTEKMLNWIFHNLSASFLNGFCDDIQFVLGLRNQKICVVNSRYAPVRHSTDTSTFHDIFIIKCIRDMRESYVYAWDYVILISIVVIFIHINRVYQHVLRCAFCLLLSFSLTLSISVDQPLLLCHSLFICRDFTLFSYLPFRFHFIPCCCRRRFFFNLFSRDTHCSCPVTTHNVMYTNW